MVVSRIIRAERLDNWCPCMICADTITPICTQSTCNEFSQLHFSIWEVSNWQKDMLGWNDFSQAGFDDWDHLRQLAIIGFCFWLARNNATFIAAASSQLIYANALCKDSLHDLNPSDWYSIFIHSQHTFNFHFVVKNPLITQYAFIYLVQPFVL